MGLVVRFAPSPTGWLHIGNARTALYNALIARREGGRFVLRLDDTDRERSQELYAAGIVADLDWLGIPPDETVRQSDRLARYDAAAADLERRGLLYPCFETAEELEFRRRRRRARGLPPVYDRAALALSAADRERFEREGRRPHWRFRLPVAHAGAEAGAAGGEVASEGKPDADATVHWDDLCRGPETVHLAAVSDPVLIREDGSYLYTLPSVVDDIELGVTHIVRGDDHVTNTGVQIALFRALGAEPPRFGHHNLLVRADGEMLSKRAGAMSLRALREDGFEPMAVASLAVLIGTSRPVEAVDDLDALAARLDLSAVSKSPARFDLKELERLNAALVHRMPYARVAEYLAALGIGGGERFWEAVRSNLVRVADAREWWEMLEGPVAPGIDPAERAYLAEAAACLPDEPWDETTFAAWTGALAARTGRRGKALFGPLRRALTGRERGPELARILPLMGRRRTEARLRAA